MEAIINKIKGPEYPSCSVEESLRLPSTNPKQSKDWTLSFHKSTQILPCTAAALGSSCLAELPTPQYSFQDSPSIKEEIMKMMKKWCWFWMFFPAHSLLPAPFLQPPQRSGCCRPRRSSAHSSGVFEEESQFSELSEDLKTSWLISNMPQSPPQQTWLRF